MKESSRAVRLAILAFCILIFLYATLPTLASAAAQSIGASVSINPVQVNETKIVQQNFTVVVGGGPVTIDLNISYQGSGFGNHSVPIPTNWTGGGNWTVFEGGVAKSVIHNSSGLFWAANLSFTGAIVLRFTVPPPIISFNKTFTNGTIFMHNLTISTDQESYHSVNVSVVTPINSSFANSNLSLLWNESPSNYGTFVRSNDLFHFATNSTHAKWDNVNTSNRYFRIESEGGCTESWTCGDWSDSANSCGSRTCTDSNSCGTTVNKPATSATCPSAAAGGGGGGGGAGGAAAKPKIDFDLEPDNIRLKISPGATERRTVKVTNKGSTALSLNVNLEAVANLVFFTGGVSEYVLKVPAGESRTLELLFSIPADKPPGLYSGFVMLSSSGVEKTINIIAEIIPKEALFDVKVDVPPKQAQVFPGDEVLAGITIFNLGEVKGRVDVRLEYAIQDTLGKKYVTGSETLAVETQTSIVRSLKVPSDAKPGTYIFFAQVKYKDQLISGSDLFEVVEKPGIGLLAGLTFPNVFLGFLSLLMLIFMLFIILAVKEIAKYHVPVPVGGGPRPQFVRVPEARRLAAPRPSVPSVIKRPIESVGREISRFPQRLPRPAPREIFEKAVERVQRLPEAVRPVKPAVPAAKPEAKIAVVAQAPKQLPSEQKLKRQLEVLEEAFRKGAISRKAYEADKARISEKLSQLKNNKA